MHKGVHKKVDNPQKKVEEEEKGKDFSCWICENVSSTKSVKELTHEKKIIMIKLFNTHQVQLIGKLVTPGLLVTVSRLTTHRKQA